MCASCQSAPGIAARIILCTAVRGASVARPREPFVIGFEDREESEASARHAARRPGFMRRHKALTALIALFTVLGLVAAGGAWWVGRQLDSVPRIEVIDRPDSERPPKAPEAYRDSLNILLAGADNGEKGDSIAQSVASGTWRPGQHRSDTLMLLHITADRKSAYLVSIPRDTYVNVEGYGMQKINAAFSYGGPALMTSTVEDFTGLRVDHVAIIDWNGFKDLSTAVGGVRVYVPEDIYDPAADRSWSQGYHDLQGDEALAYVRMRYGLADGDYDRIQRQQNFLRTLMSKLISTGTLTDPGTFRGSLRAITRNLTVDEELSGRAMFSLGWGLRDLRTDDITFLTTPRARYADTAVGSVIVPDEGRTAELFGAVRTDDLDSYVAKYGGEGLLGQPDSIS